MLKERVVILPPAFCPAVWPEGLVVIIPAMSVLLLLPVIVLPVRLVVQVLPALKPVPRPEESVVLLGLVKVKFRTPRVAAATSVVHPALPHLPVTGAMVRLRFQELKILIPTILLPEEP